MASPLWSVATVVPPTKRLLKTQTTGRSTEKPNCPSSNHTADEGRPKPDSAPTYTQAVGIRLIHFTIPIIFISVIFSMCIPISGLIQLYFTLTDAHRLTMQGEILAALGNNWRSANSPTNWS